MNSFLKTFFASCLGIFVGLILLFLVGGMIVGGLASSMEHKVKLEPNSVLYLDFKNLVPERTNNVEVNPFELENDKVVGLQDHLRLIDMAAKDEHIKGIYLSPGIMMPGMATSKALRDALEAFRQKGKFVISYADYYSQSAYYMASVADKVYMNPSGMMEFRGMGIAIPFFKEMLDKAGIKMQVYYAGQFKSATEPFRLNQMSEQNRLQLHEYLGDIYGIFLDDISRTRKVPVNELRGMASGLLVDDPKAAVSNRLLDALAYEDEAGNEIKRRMGLKEKDKLNKVTVSEYYEAKDLGGDYKIKDKIAVVYAEGDIVDNGEENGQIVDDKYVKILRKVIADDKVKAIVLRVNSPGGSVIASENIWREVQNAKAKKKPVVVSMGDYAASGGYYISCSADSIFAQENTLTGSIGVFSLIPNVHGLFKDKLGISMDTVKTSPNAIGPNGYYEVSGREAVVMQKFTDDIYQQFLQRVANGRRMKVEDVHAIAQGRVWTGKRAVQIGLVDRIGNLDDAVRAASSLAKIKTYRLDEYPRIKDPFQQLLDKLMNKEEAGAAILKEVAGSDYEWVKELRQMREAKGPMMRLPFKVMVMN